jgi:hypothetical protein
MEGTLKTEGSCPNSKMKLSPWQLGNPYPFILMKQKGRRRLNSYSRTEVNPNKMSHRFPYIFFIRI